ncbi:MAG: universal stress protein [Gammaproteobacteria bacterium]
MAHKRRILVVIDPTAKAQPALERASWLAAQSPSLVELFICEYSAALVAHRGADPAVLAEARKRLLAERITRLHALAEPLIATGIEVAMDVRWDSPLHEGIARKAAESRADFVMKDTHYVSPIRRALFSNTDWNLIRSCPTPLWLAKPRAMQARPCVIAAIDPLHEHDKPAKLDHAIVAAARTITDATGGVLHLFHGIDFAPVYAASAEAAAIPVAFPPQGLIEIIREEHETAVLDFADAHGIATERVHIAEGFVRHSLIDLTDRLQADVVVMGAISRSSLKRFIIGSTAEDLLDHVNCDLLIVKPAEQAGETT